MMQLLDALAERSAAARAAPRVPADDIWRWLGEHGAWQDRQALRHMQDNLWMLLAANPFGLQAASAGVASPVWKSLRPVARAVEHGAQRVRWRNHPVIGPMRNRLFPERIRNLPPDKLPKAPLAFAGGLRETLQRPPFDRVRPGPGGGGSGAR